MPRQRHVFQPFVHHKNHFLVGVEMNQKKKRRFRLTYECFTNPFRETHPSQGLAQSDQAFNLPRSRCYDLCEISESLKHETNTKP